MGEKGRNELKFIINTRNKHASKFKTCWKLNNASRTSIVEIIAVFQLLSDFHFK